MTALAARVPLHVVLADAADIIDGNGWHVGDYCDYTRDDPARCRVCAAGAVILAAGGAAPDDRDDADAELCWFARYLTDHGHDDDPDEDFPVGVISVWNDSRRHVREVTTTLRAAAAAAAREGVTPMNIRLMGRPDEIDAAVARLRAAFPVVVSVSAPYPCREPDQRVRVYMEVIS